MEGYCRLAIIIVHHHANGRFDLLISEQQSINPSREAISILSGKYKRFTFVHPMSPKFFQIRARLKDEGLSTFIGDT